MVIINIINKLINHNHNANANVASIYRNMFLLSYIYIKAGTVQLRVLK